MKRNLLTLLRDIENGVDVRKQKDGLIERVFLLITTRPFIDDSGLTIRISRDWYSELLYIKRFGIKKWLEARKEAKNE